MSDLRELRIERWSAVLALFACAALLCVACAKSKGPNAGTNTNWLAECEATEDCDGEARCLCGVCTLSCTSDAPCSQVGPGTTCTPLTVGRCGSSASSSACLPRAGDDLDASDADARDASDVDVAMCPADMTPPVLSLCVVSNALAVPQPSGPVGLEMRAKVVELGRGAPPERCFVGDTLLGDYIGPVDPLDSARWIRIDDGAGKQALIGVIAPGFEWGLQLDATVDVAYERQETYVGRVSPDEGYLELRASDGALLSWFGFGARVDVLEQPVELLLSQGPAVCRGGTDCVPLFLKYDLLVRPAAGSEPTVVAYGAQGIVGDFTITHGGVDLQSGRVACADAFVARAYVSAWRTPDSGRPAAGLALERAGDRVRVTDRYRACGLDEDCITASVSCAGCCDLDAIRAQDSAAFEQNRELACAGYEGPVCACTVPNAVARCVERKCQMVAADPSRDCFAPERERDLHLAQAQGAVGCECERPGLEICIGSLVLTCTKPSLPTSGTEGARWAATIGDGPCKLSAATCREAARIRPTASACLAEFQSCKRLEDGRFCGVGCHESKPCTSCAPYEAHQCTGEMGETAYEALCGDVRYRRAGGPYGGHEEYWDAATGVSLAYTNATDTRAYCGGAEYELSYGDLSVIRECQRDLGPLSDNLCPGGAR